MPICSLQAQQGLLVSRKLIGHRTGTLDRIVVRQNRDAKNIIYKLKICDMSILKNNWLRISLSLTVLLFGIIGLVFALNNGEPTQLKVETKQETLKWFQIDANVNRTESQSINPSQATYLGESVLPPAGTNCNDGDYQCVSGFRADQVTTSNELDGAQIPQMVGHSKD